MPFKVAFGFQPACSLNLHPTLSGSLSTMYLPEDILLITSFDVVFLPLTLSFSTRFNFMRLGLYFRNLLPASGTGPTIRKKPQCISEGQITE